MNIYRSSRHSTFETSTYKLIYNILLLIGVSDSRACDCSIIGSSIHIGLKQENKDILPQLYININILKFR
jgi:hypothetical protein